MYTLHSDGYPVYIGPLADSPLRDLVSGTEFSKAKKFVLVDENSLQSCFPRLVETFEAFQQAELIEIESGEQSKTIDICTRIWEALAELGADRHSLFVNLGGGVISDMGGFIAATYKRGIPYIHIPTTLLAQVDASVGGKVGVDLGGLKNMVGLFSYPRAVFIDPAFLLTLSKREVMSGFAEVIKHALLAGVEEWQQVQSVDLSRPDKLEDLIYRSVNFKNTIVLEDPFERDRRKILNLGHTIGHAVESLSFEGGRKPLTHGEAIVIGIICESWLSQRKGKLSSSRLEEISGFLTRHYPFWRFDDIDFHRLLEIMRHDKKNRDGSIRFTLLDDPGSPRTDCDCTADEIREALRFYLSLSR